MSPLHRAITIAEDRDAACVPENLGLDVTGALEVALAEDGAVAERRLRFARSGRKRLVELAGGADDPHAAAAASRRRLDDEREADLVGRALRQRRHAGLARDPLRLELVASEPERVGRRPDPRDARPRSRPRRSRRSRRESRSRGGPRRLRPRGRAHVLGRVEVRGDLDRLVGGACVERAAIVGRDDRDRLDSEPACRCGRCEPRSHRGSRP